MMLRRAWRRHPVVRGLAVAYLLVVAAIGCTIGVGMVTNLWAESPDGSVSFYLLIGLPVLALGVAALVAAVGIWRDR